ncbi:MAG: hypothetical protein H6R02_1704 [Burkholderiaceae bacterium]|nr:hypothetical protein [Burkholderiaceae bacterium]
MCFWRGSVATAGSTVLFATSSMAVASDSASAVSEA